MKEISYENFIFKLRKKQKPDFFNYEQVFSEFEQAVLHVSSAASSLIGLPVLGHTFWVDPQAEADAEQVFSSSR